MAKQSKTAKRAPKNAEIFRFAHPFFTDTPPEQRAAIPGIGKRMAQYAAGQLLPIPAVRGDSTMQLSDIIGQKGVDDVVAAKKIIFHSFGDSGHPNSNNQEEIV